MAVNQNTIQERLQVLHDYIQRTIDALNDLSSSTRQVVHGLGGQVVAQQRPDVMNQGLSHAGFTNQWQPQVGFIQTPYGIQQVQLGSNPMFNNQGFVPAQAWNQISGLQHASHNVVPQHQVLGQNTMFQFVQTPYGLMQVPVANNWIQGGLQHSSFPQVWNQSLPLQSMAVPYGVNMLNPMVSGLQHTPFVRDTTLGIPVAQTNVITGQPVVGNSVL